jgi:predicted nucleic acid-binding protein
MIVLIDTNVLLDVLHKRPIHYDDSSRVWNLAENKSIQAHVSAISFNNIFYILRKQVGSAGALDGVKLVRAVFTFVPLDEQLIDSAIAAAMPDLEDAIQAAAASRVSARHISTRNKPDFAPRGISALTPEELLLLLKP